MGRLCKGSLDLAKLEPALSRHPSGRISNHARVFALVTEPHSGATSNNYKFMKPTPQISHKQQAGLPLTDCNYRPTADPKSTAGRKAAKLTGFHKLSSDFIGTEMVRDYATEF